MLADVGREGPRWRLRRVRAEARQRFAFHELHVPPSGVTECARVVVRSATPVEPVFGHAVPLFARNFARLAADAKRRVGEKRGGRHADFLISSVKRSSAAGPRGRLPAVMLQSSPLVSMMRTFGSSETASRSFGMSPLAMPDQPQ